VGTVGSFPREKSIGEMEFISHCHLVPRLRMTGTITLLLCMPSWLGQGQLYFNPLNAELNPICYLLALLANHFLHVSRIRVKSLTLRLLMSYIYIWSTYS